MFTTMLTTFLALFFLAASLPIPQFSPPPPDTRYYRLKALVTQPYDNPSAHSDFNNTYLEAYHTGAGLNDATFSDGVDAANAPDGFLNGTRAQFNLSSADAYFPWTMIMPDVPYSTFSAVEINAGLPDEGTLGAFYFNQSASGSLWYNTNGNTTDPYYQVENNGFGGWLVCNWAHQDTPQLFWINSFYISENPELPENCAPSLLVPEYTN